MAATSLGTSTSLGSGMRVVGRFAGVEVELLETAGGVDLEDLGAFGPADEGVGDVRRRNVDSPALSVVADPSPVVAPDLAFEDVQDLVFAVVDVQGG